jgi:putative heme-binding domain-containing protein
MPEITRPSVRVVAFGEDKDGEIYFLDYDIGTVHTIERNIDAKAQNSQFPTKLSHTGLFASVKDNIPATGVEPFTINAKQWQDGAASQHWAAFTGTSFATLHAEGKPILGNVYWHNFRMHFPKDAVLVKTLSLGKRRIETQLMHFDGEDWHGYSFAWRDDQTDADLVSAEGDEKEIAFDGRKQVWQFHSRAQCVSCHHSLGEYALAFQPGQLNRDDGRDECNQLISLTQSGLIRRADKDGKPLPPFDHRSVKKEVKMANPSDTGESLAARARAYLHANCGHCHCEHGGGTVSLRLNFGAELGEMKAIGIVPSRGDFGIPHAHIIQPGDPASSTLYYRMGKFGRDRMPHIGAELPDEFGLSLIGQWITDLGKGQRKVEPVVDGLPPELLLENLSMAQAVARKIGRGELKPAERDRLLAVVAKLPSGGTRDLFEGFLPRGKDGERKLGPNPRPATILAVKGDAVRGEKLFWSQEVHCGNCHKVGERGKSVGPDLSTIGKLRTRPDLLESMLQPSRRIEPKFSGFAVRTLDGKSVTGIMLKRDEKEVVIRDAEGKDFTFAASDVESMRPLRISLMPDGQMGSLTAQHAADLLEYLTQRK